LRDLTDSLVITHPHTERQVIEVKHLTKAYKGRIVVDDLSFNVATGESVALWGPNGAGKTTVIRCILGLISHQGHITVAGFDTKRDSTAARSLIGYVPQEPALYGALTINETLALSCRLRNLSLDLVSETADLLNLAEPGRKRVADLSGGMRQRLAIGISLLADPLILLLDEPTSSLDLDTQRQTAALLQSLKRPGRAFVLTSHRVQEVEMLTDHVIALDAGRKVGECTSKAFTSTWGIQSWLNVTLPPHQAAPAQTRLEAAGYQSQQYGRGVLLQVSAKEKADALTFLHNARFDVLDFEVWR